MKTLELEPRLEGTTLTFDADADARTRTQLRLTGTSIGPIDTAIAATAVVHGCTVVTHHRKHFDLVLGLAVEDWEGGIECSWHFRRLRSPQHRRCVRPAAPRPDVSLGAEIAERPGANILRNVKVPL